MPATSSSTSIRYAEDVKKFLDEKQCYEDGHAAERIVDFICELSEKAKENG